MVNKRFGKLTVKCDSGKRNKNREILWECVCDCGTHILSNRTLLKRGKEHCGCSRKKVYKHSHSTRKYRSTTYISWGNMIQRCTNPKHSNYKYYGGRGIEVCSQWRSFENFLKDMGERPKNKTIERIDNNGNYTPDNCKWDSMKNQFKNRRYKSGRGYYWSKSTKKWQAYISINGKQTHLGLFKKELNAKRAYNKKKKELMIR